MSNTINIVQLIAVAEQLDDIKDQIVFVGGSITALLVDDVAANSARQTEDVDFIVDIKINGNLNGFEEKMRKMGFRNDTSEDALICRWIIDFNGVDLKVDAMPINENVFGFSNIWYEESIQTSWKKEIKEGLTINVIDPVYFLATKIEAFKGRGNNELFSHDIEDIMYVLENRSEIEKDIFQAPDNLKKYLSLEFKKIAGHPDLENTLPGILDNPDSAKVVLSRISFISALK